MIKLFRHIRKSLLMENKTGKYHKYTKGEIVFVVLVILIPYLNSKTQHFPSLEGTEGWVKI